MNKNIIKLFICLTFILILTGCKDKDGVELKKGSFSSVCTNTTKYEDGSETSITETTNYDENKMFMNSKLVTIEKFAGSRKKYELKKLEYDKKYRNSSEYIFSSDDKKQIFKIVSITQNLDISSYSEEQIDSLKASNYIKSYEKINFKCTVNGISRKELDN